ncbi:leukotoxin LktA family filamentous adhesin [Oleiagrimonas citrea]|uniref:Leukotoxin LktA family filamentous adhesin n=1 Tax=Oleiagrimonas citrea TaxID=1665687 RepID=A0A846ZJ90_9GAMM|nr:leukotoxin LktA family filamentous adhesin [Oleiagrimonas citrea]
MKSLVAAMSAVLGVTHAAGAMAASNINKDGRTQTTVTTTPASGHNTYDIVTSTLNAGGNTGFNSFHDFQLDSGDTVNMHVPTGAKNLVNLVWDSQTVINGTLNSYIGNSSKVGGNVFFADPHGIVVGNGATLNVGALSLSAPTADFMSTLLDSSNNVDPDATAVNLLLTGQEPEAAAGSGCMICIRGTINAQSAVRVRATAIDVSGTIYVQGDAKDTLSTAVNVEGQTDPQIVSDGNTIRLIADASEEAGFGDADAKASVNVSGTLTTDSTTTAPASGSDAAGSWGLIQATAHAEATAEYKTPTSSADTVTLATGQVGDLFKDQESLVKNGFAAAAQDANLAASDKLGQVAYVRASAEATVDVTGSILAAGDVDLASSTAAKAATEATSEAGSNAAPVMVGAMYGAIYSKAETNVGSAAVVHAGGALSLNSDTENELEVSAETVAGDQALATTVAWSQAAVESASTLDGDIQAQSIQVLAHNSNSFSTEAKASTNPTTGSVGAAGAVSLQTVSANAKLDSSPTLVSGGSGDVVIAAGSDTSKNATSASTDTEAESTADTQDKTAETNADLGSTLANKSNGGLNADGSSATDALPFHLGAAVAYTDSSNTANASIGDGVKIDTEGSVTVYSNLTDAGIHSGASSAAVSKADEGDTDSSGNPVSVDVAAAVAYAHYSHDASATIGKNADITAENIGVGSNVNIPFDWYFGNADNVDAIKNMFGSLDQFVDGATALKDLAGSTPEDITNGVSGYASASAGGDTPIAVGGSVNYFAMTNRNTAWVGDGATLHATSAAAATPGQDSWESEVEWLSSPVEWEHSIDVQADTSVTLFNLVGDITPWKQSTKGDKAAIGGAFNYTGYKNTTVAGVGGDASLTSDHNDVAVNATSTDRMIALSPISGKGGTLAMQGTVAITDVDDTTHATLSAGSDVDARALDVVASNPVMIWSLSGALAMSSEASIGISVGINQTTTDTVAKIGDNRADDPAVAGGAMVPSESGGTIAVDALNVNAVSSGQSGALSLAGSKGGSNGSSSSGSGSSGDTGEGESSGGEGSGEALTSLIENIKTVNENFQTGLAAVDGISSLAGGSDDGGGDSMLDKAGEVMEQVSSASESVGSAAESLNKLKDKASGIGKGKGGSEEGTSKSKGGKFGIGVSGSASVNIANLGAKAEIDGVTLDNGSTGTDVTVQALDQSSLISGSGAAALSQSKSGFAGAIAGAVAYSSVANTTTAVIADSTLNHINHAVVRALDGSLQVDVALGVATNTSNTTSTTIAGSVSIGKSANTTHAGIEGGSTLTAGGAADSSVEVTAYDHSRIGVGGGSLYFNKSGATSGNVGVGFTYADIGNTTSADLSGHTGAATDNDISGFKGLTLRALDSSLIGAGSVAGGYSASQDSASLAGAVVWTQIGNTTQASVDSGMRLGLDGDVLVQASAVAPISELDSIVGDRDTEGYDFTGATLGAPSVDHSGDKTAGSDGDPSQPGSDVLTLGDSGVGSSIIAIAGTVQVGGNNVGLSYVGNNVHNTHTVRIDDASIDTTGSVQLGAHDDTRIVGLAVGVGVSSGQFAGLGSATSNVVGNTDSILLGSAATAGHTANIHANSLTAEASDDTRIYSLAGNVAVGKGQAAAGGALTYNDIANTITTHAGHTSLDITHDASLNADESAQIMAGAVAGAASKGFALTLSFGWNQTADSNQVLVNDASAITAGSLSLGADNAATIYALSGGVSIGGRAAVGLAASVSDIGDTTHAGISNAGLDVASGAVNVHASGTGTQYALSVAGAVGSQGAGVAGAETTSLISSDVTASANDLYGLKSDGSVDTAAAAQALSLSIEAENTAGIYSLAGGVGIGQSAGVGAAATIADVGGSTSASLSDSTLDVTDTTDVNAHAGTTIDTASLAGSAASSVAVSASDTTNLIHNSIAATMTNVAAGDASDSSVVSTNVTTVSADNDATINALSGAVGGAGSVAVGAAVSVNNIATTTRASFLGSADGSTSGPVYKARQVVVQAGTSSTSHVNTIAVGAAGGGSTAVGGSVAVNLLGGTTSATIANQADVIASDNVGVLAGNQQGINVFAGQAAIGGDAGVGIGVVVNKIDGSTDASVENSDVSAYGHGSALSVDAGTASKTDALQAGLDIAKSDANAKSISDPTNYLTPDLSGSTKSVHGVAVNAVNQQSIATLGVGASVSGGVAVSGQVGVNIVGGSTSATIDNAHINQADRTVQAGSGSIVGDNGVYYTQAASDQQVDVTAGSRQYEANFIVNVAGSGGGSATGSVATNVFNADTSAKVSGSTVSAQDAAAVDAVGQQWSLITAVGASVSGGVGGAASGGVNLFQASTRATLDGGTLDAGSLDVLAQGDTVSAQFTGALGIGIGAAGLAGAAGVNVDHTTTTAKITGGATVVSDNDVHVDANSKNVAQSIVVGAAGGSSVGIAGGAVVNVVSNNTHASIEGGSNVTAADVAVDALDQQFISAYSGVLGGGFVGVGGGMNLVLLQSSVGAGMQDSTVHARGPVYGDHGHVDVHAESDRDIESVAVAVGGGAVGTGLSASVVVAGTGDITGGGGAGDDLTADGQLNLNNLDSLSSGSKLDSDPSSYGLNDSQLSSSDLSGINSSASYSLSSATGSSHSAFGGNDGVQAKISGGSVTANNDIDVDASVKSSTDNIAGSGAVGVVGVGGSVAYTSLNSDIQASVGGGTATAGHGISIQAGAADGSNGPAAKSTAYAGVGGLVGVGAAVAISDVHNTVSATAGGTLDSSRSGKGTLSLKASDSSTSLAGNANQKDPSGINVGGVVAGAVVVDANRSSTVSATLADSADVNDFGALTLSASDSGAITANGVMGSGGILTAISAVVATASDSSHVTAHIGTHADITAGSTSVTASADPVMNAGAVGITVGGIGGGIGANVAVADMTASVEASVADYAVFHQGTLSVDASVSPTVNASSSGGAGAAMLGVNASTATASDTASANATVGDSVTLPTTSVSISATSDTHQDASATGVSVGLVAAGASVAKATSNTTINASLGNGLLDSSNNPVAAATTGALSVIAHGSDSNIAYSKAGSGGLVSGNGASATTSATSTSSASVGQNLDLANLASFQLSATQNVEYGGEANSVLAAAVGGSGANVDNTIATTTNATIGNGTAIATGGDIDVLAKTLVASADGKNAGAIGGAGGVVTGTAAGVNTTVTAHNNLKLGTDVQMTSGLDSSTSVIGHISLVAGTLVGGMADAATISTGGAVPVANANVHVTGQFGNDLEVGDGSNLLSYGRTNLATYTVLDQVAATATSNAWGAAPVGASDSSVNLTSNQTLKVGDNVHVKSYDEADIVAGRDILGLHKTKLAPSAVAQSYVRGFIAIPHASATANTTSNATLTLGSGSTVIGAGDVAIGAVQGDAPVSTNGTGHGYELGFIPATQHSNHQSSTGTTSTTIDGTVVAGAFNKVNLKIAQDGTIDASGTNAPYNLVLDKTLNPTTELNKLNGTPDGTYNGIDNANVGGILFDPLYVGGGNVYLYGASVGGNGTITAQGAPSVTIDNASPYYMFIPKIEASFGSSGSVLVSGGANPSALGNLTVNEAPSDALPTVTINSTYPSQPGGATPGIILGDVVNLGGSLNIKDLAGSLLERGEIHTNSQNVYVPNGYVVVKPTSGDTWFSGADPTSNLDSSWIKAFLDAAISDPDHAAAAIAQSYYDLGGSNGNSVYFNNTYYSDEQAQVLVLYGSCAPHTGGSGSEEALDGCNVSGPSGTTSVLGRPVPNIPYVALQQSGKFSGNQLASTGAYTGQKFIVEAKYIDIDGAINAGTPATWTVQTTDALKDFIAHVKSQYAQGQISNPNIQLTAGNSNGAISLDYNGEPLLTLAGGQASQLIGATYNVANNQLILNNVNASGGGSVRLSGKIVSTAQGSININSGYGSVTVDNTTGVPLVVQNVFAGSGGLGLITLDDKLKTWTSGANAGKNVVTWYVSQDGAPAKIYDNYNGATDWTDANARLLGGVNSSTQYAPKAGAEYQWTASTSVARSFDRTSGNHSWSLGDWGWSSASGGTAGQHWALGSSGFIDGAGSSGYVDLAGNDYKLSMSGYFTNQFNVIVAYHGCDSDGNCHYGSHQSGTDSSGNAASLWGFIYPYQGTLTVTDTQRADLPININFITSASNNVDITSNNDVLLSGQITNTHGPTSVHATQGDIVQSNDHALIWTHSLALQADAGQIGSASDPIQVKIAHDSNPGSTLTAQTGGGDIALNVDSGSSAQQFSAISSGVLASGLSSHGDVLIRSTGSLVGIPGRSVDVIGRDVNLTSTQGGIGSIATPLNIETHADTLANGAPSGGQLDAHGVGDVALNDTGGDVWVGSMVSDNGDVRLSAPNGGIYDARQLDADSTLSSDQARKIWDQLHLTDGNAADTTIAAIEQQVDTGYAQYYQLLKVGTVSNGQYTLNSDAVDLYWPLAAAANGMDPSSVTDPATRATLAQQYVSDRYQTIVKDFTTYIGTDWQSQSDFAGTDPVSNFSFTMDPNSDAYKNLTKDSTWTEEQLTSAINEAALGSPTGGTVGTVAPNLSGKNVTLIAGDGGIGRTDKPLSITYQALKDLYAGSSTALTAQQVAALGLANAPGDVQLIDASGNVISPDDPNLQNKLDHLSVTQTMPLYVTATGTVTGSASASVYLQANGDLHFDDFSSGTDMRVAATGSIGAADGVDTSQPVLTSGGDLLLTAGGGYIGLGNDSAGGAGDALPVQIGGELRNASAATDLLLTQLSGDLRVGTVFANGLASLDAQTGSILAQQNTLSIKARDIVLTADGDIGRRDAVSTGVDAPLKLQVGSDGSLNATAGGAVNIDSPTGNLHVGTITSGDNLVLTAELGSLDAKHLTSNHGTVVSTAGADGSYDDVQADGDVTLGATGSLTEGSITSTQGNVLLTGVTGMQLKDISALAGTITAKLIGTGAPVLNVADNGLVQAASDVTLQSSGSLTMGTGSEVTSGALAKLTSSGDMTLGLVASTATSGTGIDLDAGGAMAGNGDAVNLRSRSGATTAIHAVHDIGSASLPLTVDVDTLHGSSDQGSIWLHGLGDVHFTDLQAGQGNLDLSAQNTLAYDNLVSGGDSHLQAQTIQGTTLQAGGSATFASTGDTTVDTVHAGSFLTMNAGGNLTATTLNAGTDATLIAGGLLSYTNVTAGGDGHLQGQVIQGGKLVVGGHADTTSTTDTTVDTIQTGDDLVMNAGGNLTATTLDVGTDATLTAGGLLSYTNVTAGGDGHLQGQVIQGGKLVVGGHADTTSTTDTTVDTIQTGDDLVMNAGDNLTATTLDIGTDATLTAGGLLSYTNVTAGGDGVLHGDSIQGGKLVAGGHGQLTSTANTTVDTIRTGDFLTVNAGGHLTANTLNVGTDASLRGGSLIRLGTVTTGNDLSAVSGGDLDAQTLDIGRDATLNATDALALTGAVKTGGNLDMTSGAHMGFATLDAGGHVFGQSLHGDIDGVGVTASDWIKFIADGYIHIGSMNAGTDVTLQAGTDVQADSILAGHDLDVTAGRNIDLVSATAGNAIKMDAGGSLNAHDMKAGHSIDLAANTMSFVSLEAPDRITLLARKGDIVADTLTTRDAYISAFGAIRLNAANIGDRINLAGDTIDAHLYQTSTGQPLFSALTGFRNGVARRITIDADVPQQWMIDRLAAVNAALATTAPSVHVEAGHIENILSLDTASARIRMNQHDPVLVPADVQLMQKTYDFKLYQDGVHTLTDAFVVRYGHGYQIQTPNYVYDHQWVSPDYYGDAALRYNGRTLTLHTEQDDASPRDGAMPSWSTDDGSDLVQPDPSVQGAPVNTKAPR